MNFICMYMWGSHFKVYQRRSLSYSNVYETLHLDIEACTTATTAGSKRVVCNLEL